MRGKKRGIEGKICTEGKKERRLKKGCENEGRDVEGIGAVRKQRNLEVRGRHADGCKRRKRGEA